MSRFRSPSTTVSNRTSRPSPPTSRRPTLSSPSSGKYVIRNEFGHARIQQYIVHPDKVGVHYHDLAAVAESSQDTGRMNGHHRLNIPREELFETGGHVVLHPTVFKKCVETGWGMKHPLAGHFHPITGTEIPDTTMLFRAPGSMEELEVVWRIVCHSYRYVTALLPDTAVDVVTSL